MTSPRIARIAPDGDLLRQLERFRAAVSGAADAVERGGAGGAAGAKAVAAETGQSVGAEIGKAIAKFAVLDVGRSAVASLGAAGAGAVDAQFAGIRAVQGALPAFGGALGGAVGGALGGPLGSALGFGVGSLGGTLGAAGLEREFGPEFRAREQAIEQTKALFAPAAAQGVAISKEEMAEVLNQALQLNRNLAKLDGDVRAASNQANVGGF